MSVEEKTIKQQIQQLKNWADQLESNAQLRERQGSLRIPSLAYLDRLEARKLRDRVKDLEQEEASIAKT